ncbi:MAG: gliding motility-associated C-terminal domain-containing protein [Chitinophagaceae bacterium]
MTRANGHLMWPCIKSDLQELYKGIDLIFYTKENQFKYDFIVSPQANPKQIQLQFNGVRPKLLPNGNLFIKTTVNEFQELAPFAYQEINGVIQKVNCHFHLQDNILSYELPDAYDLSKPLIIDPVLVFATYSGCTTTTYGFSATYDNSGSLYAGGEAFGGGWPSTVGAFQSTFGGSVDAGINKYNPSGSALIYATYFGGSLGDVPNNMVVNDNNELVVFGTTSSSNMPTTAGCFQNILGGNDDMYVAHFNNTGTALIGSTYIGGSADDGSNTFALSPNYGDGNRGEVYIDKSQNIVCAGSTSSTNFPITTGCFQNTLGGMQDGCMFKLNATCTNLLASTYFGSAENDACFAIVENNKKQYITVGGTKSTAFPVTPGVLINTFQGVTDGFVSILDSNFSTVVYSTFLGDASFDHAFKVQADEQNNIYVCGQTNGGTYPTSPGLYQNPGANIFIDHLDSTLSTRIKSTVVGKAGVSLVPTAFLYDVCGNIYFSGFSASSDMPLTTNAYQSTTGGFWLCVLSGGLQNLLYATYMGASGDHVDGGTSRFDPQGIVYQSVCTISSNQYQSPGSYSPTNQAASWDVASFKFDFEALGVQAGIDLGVVGNDSVCMPTNIAFLNTSTNATAYLWDFGDGTTSTDQYPAPHVYNAPGTYTVKLKAFNPTACVTEDSSSLEVFVFNPQVPNVQVSDVIVCDPNVQIEIPSVVSNLNSNMIYRWEPASLLIGPNNTASAVLVPGAATTLTLTVVDSIPNICFEKTVVTVDIVVGDTSQMDVFPKDTTLCWGQHFEALAVGGVSYNWTPVINNSAPDLPNTIITVFSDLNYQVVITDIYGCSATKHMHVKAFPRVVADAGPDDIIRIGEPYQLNASGGLQYTWSYDPSLSDLNIKNPLILPQQIETTYYVKVTDENGCKGDDSVKIYITNGVVPNAFSPNGDGKNDVFRFFPANHHINMNSMQVYNRWGQELFYSDDIETGWDGQFKGVACETDTYFYIINYSIGGKSYVYKGDFILLR